MLNTPSAHRVPHASNADDLDRNFGGGVIVLDRLFGTCKAEDAALPPKHGLAHSVTTNNPLVSVFADFIALIREGGH